MSGSWVWFYCFSQLCAVTPESITSLKQGAENIGVWQRGGVRAKLGMKHDLKIGRLHVPEK